MTDIPNITELLMKGEHFPIEVGERNAQGGAKCHYFENIPIPPYHPSMAERGIDIELALSLFDTSLEEFIKELEGVAEKMPSIQYLLKDMNRDKITGKVQYDVPKRNESSAEISIPSFPIITIRKKGLQLANGRCTIEHGLGSPSFKIPLSVELPKSLMKEYEMRDEGEEFGLKRIGCPNGWHTHNLADIGKIYSKNFIILYNNAIVREKYSI